jgi:hypothetical protein
MYPKSDYIKAIRKDNNTNIFKRIIDFCGVSIRTRYGKKRLPYVPRYISYSERATIEPDLMPWWQVILAILVGIAAIIFVALMVTMLICGVIYLFHPDHPHTFFNGLIKFSY